MDHTQISTRLDAGILVITLDRPERLNAWTPRMMAELTSALEQANADDLVGAIVLTGAGRGFCAGADIHAFDAQLGGDQAAVAPDERRDWVELVRASKPLVAAINGPCIGVGLSMVLPFDRLIASDAAKLSLRFVRMGLVPELASSHFLPQRVGFGAASDLMLSGRTLDAREALALRLIDEVTPAADLIDAALRRARSYGENPAPQLRWIKALLSENACEPDTAQVQARELARLRDAYVSNEHREAVQAFLEKRQPRF